MFADLVAAGGTSLVRVALVVVLHPLVLPSPRWSARIVQCSADLEYIQQRVSRSTVYTYVHESSKYRAGQ